MTAAALSAGLPQLIVDALATQIVNTIEGHGRGDCVRVDSIRQVDAASLAVAVRTRVEADVAGGADVHVLAAAPDHDLDGGLTIPAERAVELRNRKQRRLVLMVPIGSGVSASSLDNSFARIDIARLLADAGDRLMASVDVGLRDAVRRAGRELGSSRPVEAWSRYAAAVAAEPTWEVVGSSLWMVGLIPDLGGEELVDRLSRNARCAKAVSRPLRPVASVADRLSSAGVPEGSARDRIARFLAGPGVDLSDVVSWAGMLVEPGNAGVLTFEHWPLTEPTSLPITALRVDPFLKEDGALRTGTRLRQAVSGDLPYLEVGEDTPGSVTVTWRTEPAKSDTVDRWLLEVLPPEDLRDSDTEPFVRQTVKGDKRRATVRIDLAEEDAVAGALLVVRLTAVDNTGQACVLSSGIDAVDESQQFAVRWEAEPVPAAGGRRASAPSLAQALLDAALDGQDDLKEDAPSWDGGAFSVRVGGRRTVRLALSPTLTMLQRRSLGELGVATAWSAEGRLGEVLNIDAIHAFREVLPQTLSERRRRLFGRLADRYPRDVVETLEWDEELRAEVEAYCQTYRRALDAVTDPTARVALLTMDTLTLSVATAGYAPIAAVIVLPLHPMRLAWAAEHAATLGRWARQLTSMGRRADRRQSVDSKLVARVAPANLPFAVLGAEGSPFVFVREGTLGTGVYLDPGEAEPGAAMQAVFDVLGLDRRDVTPEVPSSVLAERIEAYRVVNPGQDAMRVLAYNPGSGELLAKALATAVLGTPDGDDDVAPAPSRVEVTAYSSRPSFTDPLPALTDLQRRVASRQVRGTNSYLMPPLGVSIRSHEDLAADDAGAHLGVVADLADVRADAASEATGVAVADPAASFRNLLTPASNQRAAAGNEVVWRTAPALRARLRDGASDAVDAHRAYQAALAGHLGYESTSVALAARLGAEERESLNAAHSRSDWVVTLDRNLGVDLFTGPAGEFDPDRPYILDYAPDFLEGLGPRLTVTTTHRAEVERLLADAMQELDLAAVDDSVRNILTHLQVVSGRLAMRLIGRSNLATEAVSLAALMAHLRRRGELDGTVVMPVDAHMDVFGDSGAEVGVRRCDLVLLRSTARTLRLECIEVKSRKAAALPSALVDDIVEQLDATVSMLRDTFFRTDPPRVDAELQRARLTGIFRHHADRALAMGLIESTRRSELERLFERVEDGALIPEFARHGYVVSLRGTEGFPSTHRGVRIDVLTTQELGEIGFSTRAHTGSGPTPAPEAPGASHPEIYPPRPTVTTTVSAGPPPPTVAARPSETLERVDAEQYSAPGSTAEPAAPPHGPSDEASSLSTPATSAPQEYPVPSAPPDDGGEERPRPSEPDTPRRGFPESAEVVLGQDAHATDVRWRISTSGSPHLFVLGIPGQGKSVTTRRILNSFADQHLPALVLDFHGDMASAPPGEAAVLDATHGLPFSPFEMREDDPARYHEAAWELSEVIGFVCGLGEIQRNAVYEGLREVYRARGFGTPEGPGRLPTMTELAEAVAVVEGSGRSRNVVARLRPLTDFGLFVEHADVSFSDLLGRGIVLDVHGLMEQVQIAAGAFVLRKVYREMFRWGQSRQLRLAVVLDEAHRLAKDVTLPKIMKEGRKYGVAVVVASQGVADFHKDVLGNAGTKVAFRCNFPQSRTVAGFMRGRNGQDMAVALENLSVGQSYISTPERAEARKVFMIKD
ncbi:DUF87 domain-containing protein [Actinomycetospora endophytica]|uniref:DUF87 domain-containing protein n=1 Tax=Actinomycetospora endophytica TaxID=2291215 RepID=A0ABS8PI08_9PSEU|nr:DUF87 domain-containing protein [Actinomycetospora endophytica]MCD2197894.1 DUF87 domain-containing protein [Actinomycetospora endophytica]